MEFMIFILIAFIVIFVMSYRNHKGDSIYKYISKQAGNIYDKYAPYSFREVIQKVKDLGQEYSKRQYAIQITVFAVAAAVISYLYFYNLIMSIIYALVAVAVIPYLTYLR